MVGQTNINTCRVSELINQNINVLKSKQNLSKFSSELIKYRIFVPAGYCFVYEHTYIFRKDYRDASWT